MRRVPIAFATVGALLASAGAAEAQNYYGAIAYSPATGSYGYSYDYGSRGQAEAHALAQCRKHASDCQVPLWFRNACGALAVGSNGWGTGWGTDRGLAESYALQTCRNYAGDCSIRAWVCTTR